MGRRAQNASVGFAPRLSFDLDAKARQLVVAGPEDSAIIFAKFTEAHEDLFERTCGRPVAVLEQIARVPQTERRSALWDACALDRFPLLTESSASPLIVLAAMLYTELQERGSVLDIELHILRDLAISDPIKFVT